MMFKYKIRSLIYRVCAFFRLLGLKCHKKNSIKMSFGSQCAPSSEICCEGKINIDKKFAILKDASLIVRKNAHVTVGNNTTIGIRSYIVSHSSITIGDNVSLAQDVKIYDHDHDFKTKSNDICYWRNNFMTSEVIIGNNCWIGANCVILRGTKIGNNCIVGAGSILKGEYPDNSIIIQKRESTIIER